MDEFKFGQCANCGGNLTSDHRCPPGSLLGPARLPLTTNDPIVLKLRIKQLESANRSLLTRVANQAETIRTVDGMMEAAREYMRVEEITMSGDN